MKYERAAREFIKSKLTAIGGLGDEFATFAQAYGKDRTSPVNAPTRKRLDATLAKTLASVRSATTTTLAVPPLGAGSFTRSGTVSRKRPAKLSACR